MCHQVCQLASFAGDAKDPVDLPAPAVFKPQVRLIRVFCF